MENEEKLDSGKAIEWNIKEGSIRLGKLGLYVSGKTSDGHDFSFTLFHRPELATVGVNSICDDGDFVIFLDYDNIGFDYLLLNLDYLSRRYGLSHFIVIKTRDKSYHAVCFEKRSLGEVQRIIDDSLCDYAYKRFPAKKDKGWILRLTEKRFVENGEIRAKSPEYVGMIRYGKPRRKSISRAHVELFARVYPKFAYDAFGYFKREDLDDLVRVNLVRYGTSDKKMSLVLDIPFVFSKNLDIRWTEAGERE